MDIICLALMIGGMCCIAYGFFRDLRFNVRSFVCLAIGEAMLGGGIWICTHSAEAVMVITLSLLGTILALYAAMWLSDIFSAAIHDALRNHSQRKK